MKHTALFYKIHCPIGYTLLFMLSLLIACQEENPSISPPRTTSPPTSSTTAIIGPEGGTTYSIDGLLTLEIPPNTLSKPVSITIKKTSVQNFDISNFKNIGSTYELEPSGTIFSNPITIKINYQNNSHEITNPENLAVIHTGTAEDKFIDIISVQNNLNDKILNFSIDHFSALQTIEFENSWAVFNFYWTIPVIKWYFETPIPPSYLNETNIQHALDLWDKETDSFRFERTFDKSQANIIFEEVYNFDGLIDKAFCYITETTKFGSTSFDFSTWTFEKTLEENNYAKIRLASNEFDTANEDENIVWARKTITHEIGHALGIAHTVDKNIWPYPVMRQGHDPFQLWNEKLHEWDINALHVHYKKAEDNSQLVLVNSWLLFDNYINPSRFEKLTFDGSVLWASEYHTKDIVAINLDENLSVKTRIHDPTANLSEYGFQPQFGLTWDGDNLWSCDAAGGGSFVDTVNANSGRYRKPYTYFNTGKIYKHANDQNLTVVSQFPAPGPFPFALAWDGANLWCYDNYENKIYKLKSDGTILNSYQVSGFREFGETAFGSIFDSGGEIYDLAWDGSSLWAITWFSGRIYKCGIVNNYFMPVKTYKTFLTEPRIGIEWADNHLYVVNYRRTTAEGIGVDKFALK